MGGGGGDCSGNGGERGGVGRKSGGDDGGWRGITTDRPRLTS